MVIAESGRREQGGGRKNTSREAGGKRAEKAVACCCFEAEGTMLGTAQSFLQKNHELQRLIRT